MLEGGRRDCPPDNEVRATHHQHKQYYSRFFKTDRVSSERRGDSEIRRHASQSTNSENFVFRPGEPGPPHTITRDEITAHDEHTHSLSILAPFRRCSARPLRARRARKDDAKCAPNRAAMLKRSVVLLRMYARGDAIAVRGPSNILFLFILIPKKK